MTIDVDITGLGQVSRFGSELEQLWAGLQAVEHEGVATRLGEYPFAGRTYRIPDERCPPTSGTSRLHAFARHAARSALTDARLDIGQLADRTRVACVLGTAMGAGIYDGPSGKPGFELAVELASELDCQGPTQTVSTACSAGLYAISLGAGLIRAGEVDVAICGGVETICRVALGCFARLEALDQLRCRPFDVARTGAVMGEGAAIMVLEAREHRRARGCERVHARVLGEGWSCDGYHVTRPEPDGTRLRLAAERALARAGIRAADIGGVLAHGTGTRHNDHIEGAMLASLLGERSSLVPVAGVKGQLGHAAGAAGALLATVGCLALRHGQLPPTGNLRELDPDCRVRAAAIPLPLRGPNVLVNAYAFGGNNLSVLLGP